VNRFVRAWWPIPAMFGSIIVIWIVWFGRYHAAGHAAGHLTSASGIFGLTFIIAVLVWAAPPQLRRGPILWVLAVATVASMVPATIGNLRVVNAIGVDNWTDNEASARGTARPGFTSGHELVERWVWPVIGFAVLLAGWFWYKHAVGRGVGITSILLSLIVPSWMIPGAGLIVLTVATVLRRSSRLHESPQLETPTG
jgi:hypothetical protein